MHLYDQEAPEQGQQPTGEPVSPAGLLARWQDTEPVRLWLWPVVGAVVALLVWYGVVAQDAAPVWLGLAAALLGVGGTEGARSLAVSPASAERRAIRAELAGQRTRQLRYGRAA